MLRCREKQFLIFIMPYAFSLWAHTQVYTLSDKYHGRLTLSEAFLKLAHLPSAFQMLVFLNLCKLIFSQKICDAFTSNAARVFFPKVQFQPCNIVMIKSSVRAFFNREDSEADTQVCHISLCLSGASSSGEANCTEPNPKKSAVSSEMLCSCICYSFQPNSLMWKLCLHLFLNAYLCHFFSFKLPLTLQ